MPVPTLLLNAGLRFMSGGSLMFLMKALKKLFPLMLACLICLQVANAEIDTSFIDGQTLPATAPSVPGTNACPYNQICTGDIVLITISDISKWKYITFLEISVKVAKDANDLTKGYLPVRSDESHFHGFYYRVKPNKTYRFEVIQTFIDLRVQETNYFHKHFYYKSRSDALNPGGSGAEGVISPSEAKAMGLPPIPYCNRVSFCTNQVVHIFWNNDHGVDKSVLDIDLYINGQHVKHDNGSEYRGNFHDFYYTLPRLTFFSTQSLSFQVTWTVRSYRPPWMSHYENSQTLVSKYNPALAGNCMPDDSWQKCQNNSLGL